MFNQSATLFVRAARKIRYWHIEKDIAAYRSSRTASQGLFSDDRSVLRSDLRFQLPHSDAINLHWIAGFIDYSDFLSKVPHQTPIVWTLHDMNPFTGGCHYDQGCGKFAARCGACPQLGSKEDSDLSRHIWQRKREALAKIPSGRLQIVADSNWLASEARRSSLFGKVPITAIHYGLDIDDFAPRDRLFARAALGIPADAKVALFVADSLDERRKGFATLVNALTDLPRGSEPFLLSVGSGKPVLSGRFSHLHLGRVSGDRFLSLVYSAADVFVIPSLQEAFGQTALESIACGTPVVGFNVGGIPEVVREGVTGLLASVGDPRALQDAILNMLSNPSLRTKLASNCRKVAVEEYALAVQAKRYVELYTTLLGHRPEARN